MKYRKMVLRLAGIAAISLMILPLNAEPEGKGGGRSSGGDAIRIRRILGTGNQAMVKTPEYQSSATSAAVRQKGLWAQILVTYDTAAKWTDELVFQYCVMTKLTEEGKSSYSLFKSAVRYVDVEEGKGHLSAVYLRPSTIKRYGQVVAVAVEISQDGKTVAEKSDEQIQMPERWWKDPKVVEGKNVTSRDGYLLERSQTPFAFINVDDYEVAK